MEKHVYLGASIGQISKEPANRTLGFPFTRSALVRPPTTSKASTPTRPNLRRSDKIWKIVASD